MSSTLVKKLDRLYRRPDFREHPIRAIQRRLHWRWRWWRTDEVWRLRVSGGFELAVPRTGSAALIYYQGLSEPEIASVLKRFLKPGMVFFDVGAHFGEYALLGSKWVGKTGQVHAFEPQTDLFRLLTANLEANFARNAVLNASAIADVDGPATFAVRYELADSSLAVTNDAFDKTIEQSVTVSATTLDKYCKHHGVRPDLIKVDVEGAEFLALNGAKSLLQLPASAAPTWILEYSSATYARFGLRTTDVSSLLTNAGYKLFEIRPDASLSPISSLNVSEIKNLLATKRPIV
jgi:FkbM family methyltransferase